MGAADSADAERITRALNLLEANGYGGFTNFQPAAGGYAATVTKNGRQMNVTVNPDTGQVTPQAG
jgi:hypothetical protein